MKTYDEQGRLLERMTGVSSDLSDLPANVGDGFLKRNAGNSAWEEAPYGTGANQVCQGNDGRFGVMDGQARVFRSGLANMGTGLTLVPDTAYFVYLGRTLVALTAARVEGWMVVAGTGGGSTGEFGLFSTPSGPNKGTQTLTKLVAGAATDLRVGNSAKNSVAFGTVIAAGTHLWAAMRSNLPTTQPQMSGLAVDFDERTILQVASPAGALTAMTTVAGAAIAQTGSPTTALAPDLRMTLD